jgi:hypothetical protein
VLPVYQDTRQKQTQIIARDKYIYKGKWKIKKFKSLKLQYEGITIGWLRKQKFIVA